MTSNVTILSYNESLLRKSDVDLLKGPHWLNDTIISFYFEYLETEFFKGNNDLLFVSPEVTQCIKISPQRELDVFLHPLLEEKHPKFIFFALNDNEQTEYSGGSHWSLLAFSRPEKTMFHYDSSRGSNESQALELAEKVLKYFGLSIEGRFEEVSSLQQNNGYDCGIHVLCNTEQLASYASHYGKLRACPKVSADQVQSKRWEILDIIEKLKRNQR
ncbi:sentrin-specific protease 8-like [Anthonomus grandis grandis]|uniref:sentrin-specific protease 8-like n=1 Tax=Anthonomus grandis grandis TaxID=2921223 RepID=UPI0021651688|nr:sentrin-specific protease 8-like [Anthonomus grandis grandis]